MLRGASAFALSAVCACNLVAGLEEFHPADGGSGVGAQPQGGGGSGNAGGMGASDTTSNGASTAGGSGGSSTMCASHLLMTEVRAAGNDTVELYNPTSTAIDLAGWRLFARSGEPPTMQPKWTGTSDVIAPGAYFVVTRTDVPGISDDTLVGIALDSNDLPSLIELRNPGGDLVDALCACAAPGDCSVMISNQERCQDKVIEALYLSSVVANRTLQRTVSCEDTDAWVFSCESLDASYDPAAVCP